MSRVFWDTNLFIYLLEGDDEKTERVEYLYRRSLERVDTLFTSHLVVGELMAGAKKVGGDTYHDSLRQVVSEMGFYSLAFDAGALETFSWLRGAKRVGVADSIHLACAALAKMDMFVTGDTDLPKLDVPGIHFVANYRSIFV